MAAFLPTHGNAELSPTSKHPAYVPLATYVCPFDDCQKVMNTAAENRNHLRTHKMPFKCAFEGCEQKNGFAYRKDLERHMAVQHVKKGSMYIWMCSFSSCCYSSTRKDGLIRHLRIKHACPRDQLHSFMARIEGDNVILQIASSDKQSANTPAAAYPYSAIPSPLRSQQSTAQSLWTNSREATDGRIIRPSINPARMYESGPYDDRVPSYASMQATSNDALQQNPRDEYIPRTLPWTLEANEKFSLKNQPHHKFPPPRLTIQQHMAQQQQQREQEKLMQQQGGENNRQAVPAHVQHIPSQTTMRLLDGDGVVNISSNSQDRYDDDDDDDDDHLFYSSNNRDPRHFMQRHRNSFSPIDMFRMESGPPLFTGHPSNSEQTSQAGFAADNSNTINKQSQAPCKEADKSSRKPHALHPSSLRVGHSELNLEFKRPAKRHQCYNCRISKKFCKPSNNGKCERCITEGLTCSLSFHLDRQMRSNNKDGDENKGERGSGRDTNSSETKDPSLSTASAHVAEISNPNLSPISSDSLPPPPYRSPLRHQPSTREFVASTDNLLSPLSTDYARLASYPIPRLGPMPIPTTSLRETHDYSNFESSSGSEIASLQQPLSQRRLQQPFRYPNIPYSMSPRNQDFTEEPVDLLDGWMDNYVSSRRWAGEIDPYLGAKSALSSPLTLSPTRANFNFESLPPLPLDLPPSEDLVDMDEDFQPLETEPFRKEENEQEEREAPRKDIPLTDSGYGSIPNFSTTANPQIPPGDSQDPTPIGSGIPSDKPDDEDTRTQYSAATTLPVAEAESYIVELCNDIYKKVRHYFDIRSWNTVSTALPSLIKALAIMIGNESSAQVNRNIMFFIHNRHKEIIAHLQALFLPHVDEEPDTNQNKENCMSMMDKMRLWEAKAGDNDYNPTNDELFQGIQDTDDEVLDSVESSTYNKVVIGSNAYKRFVENLTREFALQSGEQRSHSVNKDIRQRILSQLPAGTVSKRRAPDIHQVSFKLEHHCHIVAELQRIFPGPDTESMDLFLATTTITGTPEAAQALTIRQYLHQTWPATGVQMLKMIQNAVYKRHESMDIFLESARIEVEVLNSKIEVTAIGSAYFIAECGEQLAWLVATILLNKDGTKQSCEPTISSYEVTHVNPPSMRLRSKGSCEIIFKFQHLHESEKLFSHTGTLPNLTKEKAFVLGFPISRRPEGFSGLEVSFDALKGSARAKTAYLKDGVLLLKAGSRRFLLIDCKTNVYLWQTLSPFNELSGWDEQANAANDDIDFGRLKIGRHILNKHRWNDAAASGDLPHELSLNDVLALADEGAYQRALDATRALQSFTSQNLSSNRMNQRTEITSHLDSIHSNAELDTSSLSTAVNSQPKLNRSKFSASEINVVSSSVPKASISGSGSILAMSSPSESIDSDILSISDDSGDFEPFDSNRQTDKALIGILHQLLGEFQDKIRCRGPSEDHNSIGCPTGSGECSSTRRSSVQGSKRNREQDDDEENDNDGKNGRFGPPGKRIKVHHDSRISRSLACPFLRFDPIKYHSCCTKKLTRIRDVKQHLSRRHTPERYCQRCLDTSFKDEASLETHMDTEFCLRVNSKSLEGISYEQRWKLSRKSKPNFTEEEQWFAIWDIVFEGRSRPHSAYIDADVSIEASLFRDYCHSRGPSLLAEHIASQSDLWNPETSAEHRQAILERLINQGLMVLFEERTRALLATSPMAQRHAAPSEQLGSESLQTISDTPTDSVADSGVALGSQTLLGQTGFQSRDAFQYPFIGGSSDSSTGFEAWGSPVITRQQAAGWVQTQGEDIPYQPTTTMTEQDWNLYTEL